MMHLSYMKVESSFYNFFFLSLLGLKIKKCNLLSYIVKCLSKINKNNIRILSRNLRKRFKINMYIFSSSYSKITFRRAIQN